jgi:hypothetical protein
MTVHCKEKPYDVYIGRGKCPSTGQPGIWGNPFVIGEHGTREEVVAKYADWIIKQPEIIKNLYLLKGKTLGCWCNVSPCHGEILEGLLSSPKIAVIGSRSFSDKPRVDKALGHFIWPFYDNISERYKQEPIIISGGAGGADALGKKFSEERKLRYIEFPADWSKGRGAGMIRNEYIINNADFVFAFWDGQSPGTKHSLNLAKRQKKPTFIIYQ